jgi:hypothetical protein
MKDRLKLKKTIAREILLFFATSALLTLTWGFIIISNVYNDKKSDSLKAELKLKKTQLENLPIDKIKTIYNNVNQQLIVFYRIDKEKLAIQEKKRVPFIYSIPKKDEKKFLKSFPEAKPLETHLNGYICRLIRTDYTSDGLPILNKDPLGILKDSICDFEFVPFERFKEFARNKEYVTQFYNVFYDELDLGKLPDFEANVKDGLNYNATIDVQRRDMINEISEITKKIDESKANIWPHEKTINFLFDTALIFLLILYPVRGCYLLLKWSIKTINHADK